MLKKITGRSMLSLKPPKGQMKRRDFLKCAGAGVAAMAAPGWLGRSTANAAEQATKPNIIFILADDLGLGNVGAYGGPFKTPNIDALAREGLRFSQCYSLPVCGPSRCLALTGRYPFRTGLIDNSTWKTGDFSPVDPKRDTMIQTVMKQAGYVTACVGKWGQICWGPGEWGFDEYLRDRLYADNIDYMDKLVGQLMAELDRLHLREKTLVIFSGDNGTDRKLAAVSTVNGRPINGAKLTMEEGGSRVPLIANWPGVVPAGKVLNDLVDFSDFFPTFADLGGAKLPAGVKLDGHSFAPHLRGGKGSPRDWVFVQMNNRGSSTKAHWYVRNQGFKLNEQGELFDMAEAPFVEKKITNEAERIKLQAVLDELDPGSWTKTRPSMPAAPAKP